jgi:hypothetical protein
MRQWGNGAMRQCCKLFPLPHCPIAPLNNHPRPIHSNTPSVSQGT